MHVVTVEKLAVPLAALNDWELALEILCSVSLPVLGQSWPERCPELAELASE